MHVTFGSPAYVAAVAAEGAAGPVGDGTGGASAHCAAGTSPPQDRPANVCAGDPVLALTCIRVGKCPSVFAVSCADAAASASQMLQRTGNLLGTAHTKGVEATAEPRPVCNAGAADAREPSDAPALQRPVSAPQQDGGPQDRKRKRTDELHAEYARAHLRDDLDACPQNIPEADADSIVRLQARDSTGSLWSPAWRRRTTCWRSSSGRRVRRASHAGCADRSSSLSSYGMHRRRPARIPADGKLQLQPRAAEPGRRQLDADTCARCAGDC